eukprot:661879-Alexandrium_andersonii.AAC.1
MLLRRKTCTRRAARAFRDGGQSTTHSRCAKLVRILRIVGNGSSRSALQNVRQEGSGRLRARSRAQI